MSQHRRGEVRVRKRIPDELRRREGAHFVRTKLHVPEVCPACYGSCMVYDPKNAGDHPATCPTCDGEGEV